MQSGKACAALQKLLSFFNYLYISLLYFLLFCSSQWWWQALVQVDVMCCAAGSSVSFRLCWRYACLGNPTSFNAAERMTITAAAVPLPLAPNTLTRTLTGSAVLVSFLSPACARTTASIALTNSNVSDIALDRNSAVIVPATGVLGLTYVASVTTNCDNEYAAFIVSQAFAAPAQPAVPFSSCPCWEVPREGGLCPFPQVPITLSTVALAQGVSYRQCIDPANFDFWTGRMAYSFCWRYACLPDGFAQSDFTATTPMLARFNIPRMPGNVTYNTTLMATPGVKINVTAFPKVASQGLLVFNNGGSDYLPSGDWVAGNVTLQPDGVANMTFTIYVPLGFDDLSAAVVMDLYPGQNLPALPPAPAGSLCGCPRAPNATSGCSDDTHLAVVTRQDNVSLTTAVCLPLPQYDTIARIFAFSTCWRWSCYTAAFRGPDPDRIKPYSLTLINVTQYNIPLMPGGLSRLTMLKPQSVNMSLTLHSASDPDSLTGPLTATSLITAPDVTRPTSQGTS
ncbi:hypothetical protein V8C86DRAFT_952938 [Haematococcus lacustris]